MKIVLYTRLPYLYYYSIYGTYQINKKHSYLIAFVNHIWSTALACSFQVSVNLKSQKYNFVSLSIRIKFHLFKTHKTLLLLPLPYIRIITGRPEIINLRTGILFFYFDSNLFISFNIYRKCKFIASSSSNALL